MHTEEKEEYTMEGKRSDEGVMEGSGVDNGEKDEY